MGKKIFQEMTTHPAYGMVQFHRREGGSGKLFGSSITNPTQIALSIYGCEVADAYGRPRYNTKGKLIEIELSPAQFSELLTTMNSSPVPCTIKHYGEESYKLPELQSGAVDKAREYFNKSLTEFKSETEAKIKELKELLEKKKTITKSDRASISSSLDQIDQELSSNMPFYFECFAESTDKVVSEAKCEIDGFVTHLVHKTGLEVLKEKFPKVETLTIKGDRNEDN
jgi:uncharacterized protein YfcZ (UPF0381/DUF406 family)